MHAGRCNVKDDAYIFDLPIYCLERCINKHHQIPTHWHMHTVEGALWCIYFSLQSTINEAQYTDVDILSPIFCQTLRADVFCFSSKTPSVGNRTFCRHTSLAVILIESGWGGGSHKLQLFPSTRWIKLLIVRCHFEENDSAVSCGTWTQGKVQPFKRTHAGINEHSCWMIY